MEEMKVDDSNEKSQKIPQILSPITTTKGSIQESIIFIPSIDASKIDINSQVDEPTQNNDMPTNIGGSTNFAEKLLQIKESNTMISSKTNLKDFNKDLNTIDYTKQFDPSTSTFIQKNEIIQNDLKDPRDILESKPSRVSLEEANDILQNYQGSRKKKAKHVANYAKPLKGSKKNK